MKKPGDGWTKIIWYPCPSCHRKGYYQRYAGLAQNWFCKYCRTSGYAPKQYVYRNILALRGLNGRTVLEVKKEIANRLIYDIKDVKLFGSRITGGWREDSDLDVAIKDRHKVGNDLIHLDFFGLDCEIRFVDDFDLSWLKNSV